MNRTLTLFELADPNSDDVDAEMNNAWFQKPVRAGEIVDYDGVECQVLKTYTYQGSDDLRLQLAIIYPPELTLKEEEWFCNKTAASGMMQTRHIVLDNENDILNVQSFYSFGDAVEPTAETIDRSLQLKNCNKLECPDSPFHTLYIAHCDQRVLQVA